MALEDIVKVQISRETTVVSQVGFGTPLFVGTSQRFSSEPLKSYGTIAEVAVDFQTTDPEYLMANTAFAQTFAPDRVKIGQKHTGTSWTNTMIAIENADSDWYGLAVSSRAQADIIELANWIETQKKIFVAASGDAGVKNPSITNDVASVLKQDAFSRTALLFHNQASLYYPDAGWLGKMLPTKPGSATWKFKTLATIPSDTLVSADRDTILLKKANCYETVAGVNITEDGTTAAPEWIDVIVGLDWLTARMKERVFGALVNSPKIPYTNRGIGIIKNLVREQLDIAVDMDIIAPEPKFTVTAPDVLDVDPIDRGNRVLRDVKFTGRLAGAIHQLDVQGVVTV